MGEIYCHNRNQREQPYFSSTKPGSLIFRFSFFWIIFSLSVISNALAFRVCTLEERKALDIDGPESQLKGNIGPYLQSLSQSSVLIEWNTSESKPGRVHMWTQNHPEAPQHSHAVTFLEKRTHHVAAFCDLKPFTQYSYRINAQYSKYYFRTLPDHKSKTAQFAVLGDYGWKGKNQTKIIKQIEIFNPDWILTVGDNAYQRGRYRELKEYVLKPFHGLLASTAFYTVIGNHDLKTKHANPYLDVFSLPHNNPENTERYYSFQAGPIHFFMLDSCSNRSLQDSNSAQIQWLDQSLTQSKQPWKIVVLHLPPYSSGKKHGSYLGIRHTLHPILAKHSVDLVLSGDDHIYERSRPQDGVIYLITGAGGKSTRAVKKGRTFSDIAIGKRFHFLGFTIQGFTLSYEAIDKNGEVFDRWSKTKGQ